MAMELIGIGVNGKRVIGIGINGKGAYSNGV